MYSLKDSGRNGQRLVQHIRIYSAPHRIRSLTLSDIAKIRETEFIRSGWISLGHLVKGILVAALIYQRPELPALNFQEVARLAELNDVSGVEDNLYRSISVGQVHDLSQCPLTILSASMMVCNL